MFRTSRNQIFSVEICLLHTKIHACMCTPISDIISNTASYGQSCSPSRESTLRQAQRPRLFAQVTTCTKRKTVWFPVNHCPIRLDYDCLANLFFLVAATITMGWLVISLTALWWTASEFREYGKNLQATSQCCSSWFLGCPEDGSSSPTGGLEIKSLRQHRPSQLCPSTPPYGQTEP